MSELSLKTGLKKIDRHAFSGCGNLKRINIPDGVNIIEEYAFSDCNKDVQITIPKNITIIKKSAFENNNGYWKGNYSWNQHFIKNGTISATIYSKDVVLGSDCFKSTNTSIKCYRGSTAEKYAAQYDYANSSYLGVESKLYFDANGGSCKTSSISVTSEYYYSDLPIPSKTGYSFLGWFTQSDGGVQIKKGDLITQTSDRTVYAHWEKINVKKAKIQRLTNKSKRKLVVMIQPIPDANGYEVQYSTKKNMQGSKIKKKKNTSITISSLRKKKTYYVKVRAYILDTNGQKVYGAWSSRKKIKIRK